jgi:hypothetical protein
MTDAEIPYVAGRDARDGPIASNPAT